MELAPDAQAHGVRSGESSLPGAAAPLVKADPGEMEVDSPGEARTKAVAAAAGADFPPSSLEEQDVPGSNDDAGLESRPTRENGSSPSPAGGSAPSGRPPSLEGSLTRPSYVMSAASPSAPQGQSPPPAAEGGAAPPAGGASTAARSRPQKKTPLQLAALEAAFALDEAPAEEHRRELARELDLTPGQVASWFTLRRRKKRKESEAQVASGDRAASGEVVGSGRGPAAASGSPPPPSPPSPGRVAELHALAAAARALLPVSCRPDGPPLGVEWPSAAEAAAAAARLAAAPPGSAQALAARKRALEAEAAAGEVGEPVAKRGRPEEGGADEEAQLAALQERARLLQDRLDAGLRREEEKAARERERTESRLEKERRRDEERLLLERRRARERLDREARREEERRAKEAAKAAALEKREERRLQASAAREQAAQARRAAAEEKRREREAARALAAQEKSAMRLRAREAGGGPPEDEALELEARERDWRRSEGLPDHAPVPADALGPPPPFPPPDKVRLAPAFELLGGAEGERCEASVSQLGSALLETWATLACLSEELGLPAFAPEALARALALGTRSTLLRDAHAALLRLLQAEAEEGAALAALAPPSAAATRQAEQAAASESRGGAGASALSAGHLLDEARAWGYDVDAWRAHLGARTWPEVARQVAVAAGLGRPRPRARKEERPKLGSSAEDVVGGAAALRAGAEAGLRLRLPPRLGVGTVKAAAWLVLADVGAAGLKVDEIARRIQRRGLRDLRSSKTPEASVAGALGRDALFARVDHGTYALASVQEYDRMAKGGGKAVLVEGPGGEVRVGGGGGTEEGGAEGEEGGTDGGTEGSAGDGGTEGSAGDGGTEGSAGDGGTGDARGADAASAAPTASLAAPPEASASDSDSERASSGSEASSSGSEDEAGPGHARGSGRAGHGRERAGAAWVAALLDRDYDELPLSLRLAALRSLCGLALEGSTARDVLEARQEEQQRLKRQSWEEAKADKRRRQVEAAARARLVAEEASRSLAHSRGGDDAGAWQQGKEGGILSAEKREEIKREIKREIEIPTDDMDADVPAAGSAPAQALRPDSARPDSSRASPAPESAPPSALAVISLAERLEADAREAARLRQAQRSEAALRELEANAVRLEPLGCDRRQARYWRLAVRARGAAEPALCAGRVFVEAGDGAMRVLGSAEDLDALVAALDPRGLREGRLYASLLRHREELAAAMPQGPLVLAEGGALDGGGDPERPGLASLATPPSLRPLQPRELGLWRRALGAGRALAGARSPVGPWDEARARRAPESGSEEDEGEEASGLASSPSSRSSSERELRGDMRRVHAAASERGLLLPGAAAGWPARLDGAAGGDCVALRALLGELEAALRPEALWPDWARSPLLVRGAWVPTARDASSLAACRAALAREEEELHPRRDRRRRWSDEGAPAGDEEGEAEGDGAEKEGEQAAVAPPPAALVSSLPRIEPLEWLPPTLAALHQRLLSLDAALLYDSRRGCARERDARYTHMVRPCAGPAGRAGRGLLGQEVQAGGRVVPSLVPALPQRLFYGPRREFALPLQQFQRDVAANSDAAIAAPRPKGVGRGRGRGRGRGGRGEGGRGRGTAKQLALMTKRELRASVEQRSSLAREFANSGSDSERHYGTDYDEEEEPQNEGGGGMQADAAAAAASVAPSAAPSAFPSDEEEISPDEASEEEEISDDDE